MGSSTKPAPNSHSLSKGNQKKPTLLADYLNNDSKPAAKKPIQQAPIPAPTKSNSAKNYQPVIHQSQAQHLKMQDIDDDSDEDNHVVKNKKNHRHDDEEENEFMGERVKD